MGEATALRSNCLGYPVRGVPWTVVFPILDADGDLVTGAAGLDSEISKNGDTFADCTNEATEIATSSGMYYLTLTGTEMAADVVAVIVKTSTSGAKTTALTLYPRKLAPLRSGTAQGGDAGYITLDASAGAVDDTWNGCLCVANIDSGIEARVVYDYTASNQRAHVLPDWNTAPDSDDSFTLYLPEGVQMPTALSVASEVTANVTKISGDSTAADNCELMFDGTGYAGGTTKLGVDAVAISGDATAADNLELQYDGTGLVGATFPARQDHASGYHGAIWIDTNNGTAGSTSYVHGTADKPTNSLADALTLSSALGINRFRLLPGSSITMTANSLKQEWIGYGASIAGGNQNQAGSYFEGAILSGDWNGAIYARNCILSSTSNASGYFSNCVLRGAIYPGTGHSSYSRCCGDGLTGGLDALINCSYGNCDLTFTGYYGKISFQAIVASDLVMFDSSAGEVILESSCTGGDFVYRGLPRIQDNSDGTTVYNYTGIPQVADAVWDEAIADHAGVGSTAATVSAVKAKTDLIPASPAAVGSAMTLATDAVDANSIKADAITEIQSGLATATELAKVPKSDGSATWNATALSSIQAECSDAINAYDPPTKSELDSAVANVSVDEIQVSALADLFNTDSGTTAESAIAGSVVKEIVDHSGSSDPWSTALPGSYVAGTAGKIVGDNLNATVASRSAQSSVDAIDDFIDTEVEAIKAVTDKLNTGMEADGAVYRFTKNALEEAPSLTVADVLAGIVEGSVSVNDVLMAVLAFVGGEATGGGTSTIGFRNQADTINRITYTVDEDGNRTGVTLNFS